MSNRKKLKVKKMINIPNVEPEFCDYEIFDNKREWLNGPQRCRCSIKPYASIDELKKDIFSEHSDIPIVNENEKVPKWYEPTLIDGVLVDWDSLKPQ